MFTSLPGNYYCVKLPFAWTHFSKETSKFKSKVELKLRFLNFENNIENTQDDINLPSEVQVVVNHFSDESSEGNCSQTAQSVPPWRCCSSPSSSKGWRNCLSITVHPPAAVLFCSSSISRCRTCQCFLE